MFLIVAIYVIVFLAPVVALLGAFAASFRFLPLIARPEAKPLVGNALTVTLSVVLLLTFGWMYQNSTEVEGRRALAQRCHQTGDTIFREVRDVAAVYLATPYSRNDADAPQIEELEAWAYVRPPLRRFRVYEKRAEGRTGVVRYTLSGTDVHKSEAEAPEARYGFTWAPLETAEERQVGVKGNEVVVFDRATGEVLGRRTMFYQAYAPAAPGADPRFKTCVEKTVQKSGAPRAWDAYPFVSRVLQPFELSPEQAALTVDIAPGFGRRTKVCSGAIYIGKGITAMSQIVLRRTSDDLVVDLRGTADSLVCERFFNRSPSPDKDFVIRFYDGGGLTEREIYASADAENRKSR
jgi:hypothetical protein